MAREKQTKKLILASSSSARLKLLKEIGINPDRVVSADIDEKPLKNEKPKPYVERLSFQKAKKIADIAENKNSFIIAGDTVAYTSHQIIGKAEDETEAAKIINMLSGKTHRVYSSVCVLSPVGKSSIKTTISKVKFKYLTEEEIKKYLDSGAWRGKSGCYSLLGLSAAFIKEIHGSYTGVIGIPLNETKNILIGLGF